MFSIQVRATADTKSAAERLMAALEETVAKEDCELIDSDIQDEFI
jgi:hypothetical protein